jgi:hypothetical protein
MKYLLALILPVVFLASFQTERKAKPSQKYLLERSYSVKNTHSTGSYKIKVVIPDVVSCQNAKVLKSEHSDQPEERRTLSNGMENMVYNFNLQPGEEKILKLKWEVELSDMNALDKPQKVTPNAEDKELYLKPGTLYECDHPEVVKKSSELTAGKPSELEMAKSIYDYVKTNIKFKRFGSDSKGALYALQNNEGDCTEYAALIVAMCRAAKIPARLNGVMVLKGDTGSAGTDNHNHAEIFLSEYGWVPAEATFKNAVFGQMINYEIILRKGLKTDKGNAWFTFSMPTKFINFKEIKMLGHKWTKLTN